MSEEQEGYICLINQEEQYYLWFMCKKIPLGWKRVGPKGSKKECLVIIERKYGIPRVFKRTNEKGCYK